MRSFADKRTAAVFHGLFVCGVDHTIQQRAKMRLDRIDAATSLDDLRVPPSHRLENLIGRRSSQWSIRVNGRWRVCFVWRE
ncbi:MAG: type II toxin-antitoxin system RelE/ParE family toxin [Alphaproteobacteria bacterium]|nr:type II toxin-antitoxin system RelE/ParE family toxin [Alphaproteobacteria bacterium]